ncbi:MAG: hypothetical protein JWL86_48 [Rhizobium sp.]|nr:hypothetical protein [Rhizobium sp.]
MTRSMSPAEALAREGRARPVGDGWRKHDGYEFPGDPSQDVEIVFHNGRPSKEVKPASAWVWVWPRNGPLDFSIAWWRKV